MGRMENSLLGEYLFRFFFQSNLNDTKPLHLFTLKWYVGRFKCMFYKIHLWHTFIAVHRCAFYQFPFQLIYYRHSSKSTGEENDKTHLCAVAVVL